MYEKSDKCLNVFVCSYAATKRRKIVFVWKTNKHLKNFGNEKVLRKFHFPDYSWRSRVYVLSIEKLHCDLVDELY